MRELDEVTKLKLWLDSEITINHIYYWVILGVLIGGKFWWVAGAGIAVSVVYVLRRTIRLPKDYLSVKDIPKRSR
jgi:hypothetical protein